MATQLKLVSLIFLLLCSFGIRADINARVDRQVIYEGEPVTLSITLQNSNNPSEPDFSPLLNDFSVGATSQSSSISIINGHRSDSKTWSITLQPNKMGKITIPAIAVGNEMTQPLTIEVKPVPEQTSLGADQPLYITLEIPDRKPHYYIQQHIPLTVKLFFRHKVSGQIIDPKPKKAIIERLGQDNRYTSQHNGQIYTVVERHYSVQAEKSGSLTIPPALFRGHMEDPKSRSDFGSRINPSWFFSPSPFSSRGQPVTVKSQSIKLDILAHPSNYNGQQWLPAESVSLTDSWSTAPPVFKVGEPVSRTITITAKGLTASQIQPLELPSVSSFRRYAEPPVTDTRTDGSTLYATSERTFTYIPAYAGPQEIPAVQLHWWNVLTEKQELAELPPWKINVEKSAAEAPPATNEPPQADVTRTPDTPRSVSTLDETTGYLVKIMEKVKPWWTWLAAIAGMILVIFLARIGKQGGHHVTDKPLTSSPATVNDQSVVKLRDRHTSTEKKQVLQQLQQSCENNNARKAVQNLVDLALLTWPDEAPRNLGSIAELLNDAKQGQCLQELEKHLYSDKPENWDGSRLWKTFGQGFNVKPGKEETEQDALPPLYPKAS